MKEWYNIFCDYKNNCDSGWNYYASHIDYISPFKIPPSTSLQ